MRGQVNESRGTRGVRTQDAYPRARRGGEVCQAVHSRTGTVLHHPALVTAARSFATCRRNLALSWTQSEMVFPSRLRALPERVLTKIVTCLYRFHISGTRGTTKCASG